MEKQPYKILKSGSIDGLARLVVNAMQLEGYIPQGGVAVVASGETEYLQAMVLLK